MRSVRGPPGVTDGVGEIVEVAVTVSVLAGTVAGSGVESSEEILAQPASRNREIVMDRKRRIILGLLAR